MIIKNFDIKRLKSHKSSIYLFYGDNEGNKEKTVKNIFLDKFTGTIEKYDEKEVLNDLNNIISGFLNKSFFNDKKIVIVSRVSEKIVDFVNEILDRKIEDVKIILKSGTLEKRSKLRNLFEKENSLVCVPFYPDDLKTLSDLAYSFFKDNQISISQETINLIIEKCNGDRKNLEIEFQKILIYLDGRKKIENDEVTKLVNLAENFSVSELVDACLSNNLNKTVKILNENSYNNDDCILILRTFLIKAKRVLYLRKNYEVSNNIEETISNFKPPIFWKDKDIVKKQISNWSSDKIEALIFLINDIELQVKKDSVNSLNIIYDFILNTKALSNN